MVERLEDWPWSNFCFTAGMKKAPEYLETDWILSQFGESRRKAESRYRKFVREGLKSSPWEELKGQIFLGGKGFVESIFKNSKKDLAEVPRIQKYANRLALSHLLDKSILQNKEKRNEVIYRAHAEFGYTLKAIADYLGVHYTTVSKVIKKREGKKL